MLKSTEKLWFRKNVFLIMYKTKAITKCKLSLIGDLWNKKKKKNQSNAENINQSLILV